MSIFLPENANAASDSPCKSDAVLQTGKLYLNKKHQTRPLVSSTVETLAIRARCLSPMWVTGSWGRLVRLLCAAFGRAAIEEDDPLPARLPYQRHRATGEERE